MSDTLPFRSFEAATRYELEHGWEFLPDPSGRLRYGDLTERTGWRSARVGLSWTAQFEDLRDYMGAAWYRTSIDIPAFREVRHVLLKFGAVDYFCEVFINGVSVGIHEGGYTPFTMEITGHIHPGANEVAIHVIDPPMNEAENRALFPEMMYNEIPHGKQNWYVQNSGIWQGVRLEFCPAVYIEGADITPRINGEFDVSVRLAGLGLTANEGAIAEQTSIVAAIYDATGRKVFEHSQPIGRMTHCTISGAVPHPRLWSPESPNMYVLDLNLKGAVQYRRRLRFGFRSFEARDGKLYLNGKPFYMLAALDQDFYPETIHTPASEEFVRDMMLKAKKLGINVLRCHLKVAHPVYLDVADEIGMLVWSEMPSWSDCWFPCDHFSMRAALRGEKMFEEVMARDWNHPCIVVRTIMNESWGINLKQEEQRKWLREAYERVKRKVEPLGWLVIDNSACEGNFHIKTDIEDFHQYYSMPDQVGLWDKWLDELASRPAWTFSPFGDAERSGNEPLLVSEFGNWGLPKLPVAEELPWWFHYSFGGREVTNPSGVFERFRDYQFAPLFGNYNEFAEESQWHQFISLKYEIESMRAKGEIQGYVVTAITDVHWEVNGLMDMWRNVKVFGEELARIQQPSVVLGRPQKWTHFGDDEVEVRVLFSHYGAQDLSGARLRWTTESGASGTIGLPLIQAGTVHDAGTIRWKAPVTGGPMVDRLLLEVRTREGRRVCENYLDQFVLPRSRQGSMPARLHDPEKRLSSLRLSTDAAHQADGRDVLIASAFDSAVQEHLEQGGNVLLLIDSEDALPPDSNIAAKVRAGSELDGRWFSNFNWIRNDREPFARVSFGRILGFESARVVPEYVIGNVPPENFDDVIAGATFGWLQKNSAMALQLRAGSGKMLATTFRFHEYGTDGYATALLDAMVQYVASPECDPKLQWTRVQQAETAA